MSQTVVSGLADRLMSHTLTVMGTDKANGGHVRWCDIIVHAPGDLW